MAIVKITGTEVFVNPKYVTSIRPACKAHQLEGWKSEVEYEGNAGYRTRTTQSTLTPDELASLLNSAGA